MFPSGIVEQTPDDSVRRCNAQPLTESALTHTFILMNAHLLKTMVGVMVATSLMLVGCESAQQRRAAAGQQHLADAQHYLEAGLDDSALAAFGLALEENPRLYDAHVGMGSIYLKRGDYQLASNAYERAVEVDPNSFDAHYYLGLAQQMMGKIQEAIRVYLRALAINPESFDANQNIASAYLQINRPGQALPYAVRATELRPNAQSAWANLAAVYSLLDRYEDAIDAYRAAVELGEMPQEVLLGLADAHLKLGNYEMAINVLQTLIRREPSSTAYERLGYAQFKQRRFDASLASFRAALSIDPNDTAALNGLGVSLMTLYLQGGGVITSQKEAALQAWRRSVQLRPDQPRVVDLIARYQRL